MGAKFSVKSPKLLIFTSLFKVLKKNNLTFGTTFIRRSSAFHTFPWRHGSRSCAPWRENDAIFDQKEARFTTQRKHVQSLRNGGNGEKLVTAAVKKSTEVKRRVKRAGVVSKSVPPADTCEERIFRLKMAASEQRHNPLVFNLLIYGRQEPSPEGGAAVMKKPCDRHRRSAASSARRSQSPRCWRRPFARRNRPGSQVFVAFKNFCRQFPHANEKNRANSLI